MLRAEPGRPTTPDLTRWDLFLCVAGRPDGIALTRVAHALRVPKENTLFRPLEELVDDKLLVRQDDRYSLARTRRAEALSRALQFGVAYDIDYNEYLNDDMVAFVRRSYGFDYFTQDDVGLERLKGDLVARLMNNDLLLTYNYSPFLGKLIENPFLQGLCEFLGIRPNRAFFRRRIRIEHVIVDKLMAAQKGDRSQIAAARKLLGPSGLAPAGWGLGTVPGMIKESIVPENRDLFDPASSKAWAQAVERMRQRTREGTPLSLPLVQEYHGLAMASSGIDSSFRTVQVHVRNNPFFRTAAPKDIPKLLSELMAKVVATRPTHKAESLASAAYVYNQFLFIHPFEDGNSRTARLILGHMLRDHGLPFDEIPRAWEVRFLQTTKGYRRRNDSELFDLLKEIMLGHLNHGELEQARRLT